MPLPRAFFILPSILSCWKRKAPKARVSRSLQRGVGVGVLAEARWADREPLWKPLGPGGQRGGTGAEGTGAERTWPVLGRKWLEARRGGGCKESCSAGLA